MLRNFFRSRRSKAKLFSYIDWLFPKYKTKILFVVKDRTYFSGNIRVVLEKYSLQSTCTLYFYKDGFLSSLVIKELESLKIRVLSGFSFYEIWHILTSGTIIFSHNPRDAHITKKHFKRKIINLWHGVAIKKIELLMPNIDEEKLKLLQNNSKLYDFLIASSKQDQLTNIQAFGVEPDKVHITGLPRYEILKPNYSLSTTLQTEEKKIKKIKADKKLILFAPTFRENNISAINQITSSEWELLSSFLKKFNLILGIRPHPYDITTLPKIIENNICFYLFESSKYTEANILLKHVDLLIVDFSSIWIDYLLLSKPIVGFAKDYKWYLEKERGFVYDFQTVFPSTFTTDIISLREEIKNLLFSDKPISYSNALQFFHKYGMEYDYGQKIYDEIEYARQI